MIFRRAAEFHSAIADAAEFSGLTAAELLRRAEDLPIARNIVHNFLGPVSWNVGSLLDAIATIVSDVPRLSYIDLGCCTAAHSFFLIGKFATSEFLDQDTEERSFLTWRIRRHGMEHRARVGDFTSLGSRPADVVTVLDCLEHLPNPSEVFATIHRLLPAGGLFAYHAPWYSVDPDHGHLPEAEADWYREGGGHAVLKARFRPIFALQGDRGGLFQKLD